MLSKPLINRADIAKFRQISQTVYDEKLNSIILEAQIQDLAILLGENLFNDILINTSNYTALLEQGEYTVNGVKYFNYGLKTVLVYYTYARYQMFNELDTPFGQVEKLEGNESRPTSEKTKKDLYQLNRENAFTVWKSVENYLLRTQNILFRETYGNCHTPTRKTTFTLNKIE